jgi:hypothetical protein
VFVTEAPSRMEISQGQDWGQGGGDGAFAVTW